MEESEFFRFFSAVLNQHLSEFCVKDEDVTAAIREIHKAYSKTGQFLSVLCDLFEPVNYNNPAYRCAYLHKYGGFHAVMVNSVLSSYLKSSAILKSIPWNVDDVNICCLGGGPGTDICGLSNILSQDLEVKKFRLTTIDLNEEWASAFNTILKVAQLPEYSNLNKFFSRMISHEYIRDDLISPGGKTKKALQSADLVTMVKFVSAVKQNKVTDMLKVLFDWIKPGGMVLFIDNASGGFLQKVSEAAHSCGLESKREALDIYVKRSPHCRFGFWSIRATKVSVQMWKKEHSQHLQQEQFQCDSKDKNDKVHVKNEEECESGDHASGFGDKEMELQSGPSVSTGNGSDKNNSYPHASNPDDSKNDTVTCLLKPDESEKEADSKPSISSPDESMEEGGVDLL